MQVFSICELQADPHI